MGFDKVEEEEIEKGEGWNGGDVGGFMMLLGGMRWMLDIVRFWVMWWVLDGKRGERERVLEWGWFVVGLVWERVIVDMMGRGGVGFIERCGWWGLMMMRVMVMIVGMGLGF